MKIEAIMKYGVLTATAIVAVDKLFEMYISRKKRAQLNEVYFIMSNALPCCSHTADLDVIKKCRNPNCKAKLSRKIIEHIESAQHIICIAMYMLTMRHIGDAIQNAKRRGVVIRIITDKSMLGSSNSQINHLQAAGVPVRIAGNADLYMHNKFCLIDVLTNETKFPENTHPLNGVLITGSLNWTTNAFDRNWENIIFTSDDYFKNEYKRAFDSIWSRFE